MPLSLCPSSEGNPFAFDDACIRASWSALLPTGLVLIFCIASIPAPAIIKPYKTFLLEPFQEFLTLEEAEALAGTQTVPTEESLFPQSKGTSIIVACAALLELLLWIGVGIFHVTYGTTPIGKILPFIFAAPWFYAFLYPLVAQPIIAAPMHLFCLFSFELAGAILLLGGELFEYETLSGNLVVPLAANLVLTSFLLVVILRLPLAVPTKLPIDGELELAPEEYTSLFRWVTFAWVYPLIRRGANNPLTEKDVWNLSCNMQAQPVFAKFIHMKRSTLLRSLCAANSLDLILDAFLSILVVLLTFTGPLFLNLVLAILEQPDPEDSAGSQRLAYLYVVLAFGCQFAKSEVDAMHFYHSRRASTRLNTELMVAVYEKALKRQDFSGIVDAEAKAEANAAKHAKKAGKTDTKPADGKQDEKDMGPTAGAQLGKIVNLMSVDATTISMIPFHMSFLYSAPFQIALSVLFLYRCLGWAAFAGILFVIMSIPLNSVVAKLNVKYEKGIATARDKRTTVLNELISSIKFIKYGGSEEQWLKKANDARNVELGWLLKSRFMEIALELTWNLLPLLISMSSFYVYVKQGHVLSVSTAFTVCSGWLVYSMLCVPLTAVPFTITHLLQGSVALSRISEFLSEDEVSDEVSTLGSASFQDVYGLAVENGSFKWNGLQSKKDAKTNSAQFEPTNEDTHFELRDISVAFPEGRITCVVGPTASGKTALLLALLGEMTCLPGTQFKPPKSSKVDENGLMHCISFASQTPWLQHASIRENIVFGFPFEEERYQSVLDACALRPDLNILTDGDQTEIGIRGVTLSGGQKARVALARAVYARTKYVLLDDPLSAVDSHTARVLFDQLFCGPLLKNRTVVLVTHHLDLLMSSRRSGFGAHYIVRMLDGRIDTQGTVQDLRHRGLLDAIQHESPTGKTTFENEEVDEIDVKSVQAQPVTKLVEDEEQAKGDVQWRIYRTYFEASSYTIWVLVILMIFIVVLLNLAQKWWFKARTTVWGEAYQTALRPDFLAFIFAENIQKVTTLHSVLSLPTPKLAFEFPDAHQHPMFYVWTYTFLNLGGTLAHVSSVSLHLYGALRASRHLFRNLLSKLVYSTFRWFDTTPKGRRILNRIGKDISTVDNTLSFSVANFTWTLASLSVAIVTIAVIFPQFLVPGLFLFLAYYKLSLGYLRCSRDLRRMEANTRSPVFTGFSELLEGIVTVRAFGAEKRFLDEMYSKIDRTTRLLNTSWCRPLLSKPLRWLLLNFDYLGGTAVFVTSLFAVSSFVPAGLAGICITSAMNFSSMSYFACRFYTNLQVDLNAVERVVTYLEIPQEPPAIIESKRPPAYWPSSTSAAPLLVVEDLEVKYAPDLPAVIRRVNFSLNARERVGLLGRTGSGKSTLATSILRFVEPSGGRILVDGIDIQTIGLNDLRTRLMFIPQDATLFSGTVRDNLDPFDDYEDAECHDALARVHLLNRSAHASQRTSARETPIAELEGDIAASSGVSSITEVDFKPEITLDSMVSAEGANFSHGQRQLIALARALLRRSSIIILDEATSSIDFETDLKIQKTIREEFNDSLLLTIAHRIKTVIDYDKIIVLDQGRIAEFDTPYNLIRQEGIFRDMCMKSGAFEELKLAAKTAARVSN
ncbi:hypothetical protein C8R43DRAFT_906911 [Mycena crocata]|nr:hypothetical protein C8R43DRAFT_906911 [Mycena crocata]